jgi:CDGSH-type Zn-finger protein
MSRHSSQGVKVQVSKNGPYVVTGELPLSQESIGVNAAGESVGWVPGRKFSESKDYALCRCGQSASKPFCDGTHARVGFDGSETADRRPYLDQAQVITGPGMVLTDAEKLCAFARFCDPNGQVWTLVRQTDDPASKTQFVSQTCDCPSGRLVAWDSQSNAPIEKAFAAAAVLLEDPVKKCAGPIWLRGGVQVVGSDGFEYEVRNRVTLCRCGASNNKPFCDGSHASTGFQDGL